MRPAFFTRLVLGASLLFLTGSAAFAQGVQPLDRLLPEIRRTHPGQIYDADGPTPGPDGSPHYHLKWMSPDGRIEWLDTDARTGRVVGSSPGRDTFDAPRRIPQPESQGERMPDRFFPRGDQDYGTERGGDRYERGRGRGDDGRQFGGDRIERGRGDEGRNFGGDRTERGRGDEGRRRFRDR